MMLEEFEMPPGEVPEVMSLTGSPTPGTWIACAPVGADLHMEFVGNLIGLEPLAQNLPGRIEAKTQGKDVVGAHGCPPE